ncbi:hypothetical protein [Candidatus Solincola tengchongensis]|nr:hypothetical protein [Candidatus Solincola tengchongensis]
MGGCETEENPAGEVRLERRKEARLPTRVRDAILVNFMRIKV